jgi:hypothetical protein
MMKMKLSKVSLLLILVVSVLGSCHQAGALDGFIFNGIWIVRPNRGVARSFMCISQTSDNRYLVMQVQMGSDLQVRRAIARLSPEGHLRVRFGELDWTIEGGTDKKDKTPKDWLLMYVRRGDEGSVGYVRASNMPSASLVPSP